MSGKVVTVLQLATVLALVLNAPQLRALVWLVGAVSAWAIVDYTLLLSRERVRT